MRAFVPFNACAGQNFGSGIFGRNPAADRPRELFESSKDAESLLISGKVLISNLFEVTPQLG